MIWVKTFFSNGHYKQKYLKRQGISPAQGHEGRKKYIFRFFVSFRSKSNFLNFLYFLDSLVNSHTIIDWEKLVNYAQHISLISTVKCTILLHHTVSQVYCASGDGSIHTVSKVLHNLYGSILVTYTWYMYISRHCVKHMPDGF